MTEQHSEQHDGNTPEDRLIRYRWRLSRSEPDLAEEADSTEAIYSDAINGLTDLLEAQGIQDPHERNVIIGQLLPGPFEVRGIGLDDWLIQLRLVPLRLLDKEFPPLEAYSRTYLREVFETALPDEVHGGGCVDDHADGVRCNTALTCPALVARQVGLRQLGLLFFDIHTLDGASQKAEIERVEGGIAELSASLVEHDLVDKRVIGVVRGEMNRAARDFFQAIAPPEHRKSD